MRNTKRNGLNPYAKPFLHTKNVGASRNLKILPEHSKDNPDPREVWQDCNTQYLKALTARGLLTLTIALKLETLKLKHVMKFNPSLGRCFVA